MVSLVYRLKIEFNGKEIVTKSFYSMGVCVLVLFILFIFLRVGFITSFGISQFGISSDEYEVSCSMQDLSLHMG